MDIGGIGGTRYRTLPGTTLVRGYDASLMDRQADAGLAARLLERDESALEEVIAAYGGAVFGIARRVIAESTMAEEVAQDAFLALWRRPGAYDPDRGSLQSFLLGIARNKAIDLVRREESRRRTKEALIDQAAAQPVVTADPASEGVGERQEMKEALQRLSPLQREAIVLAYFGGRTYREVAEELGIPEGTAKTRLRDGLFRLKVLMSSPRGS